MHIGIDTLSVIPGIADGDTYLSGLVPALAALDAANRSSTVLPAIRP